MLFPYKYVPHSIEKMQEYIDHLFLEVWCEADGIYDIEKLHPELKDIVMDIYNDDSISKDHLYGPIEEIYNLFLTISKCRRTALKKWYANNNAIEQLCVGNLDCKPLRYKDLKRFFKDLAPKLEIFFKSLFTDVIHLKAFTSRVGKVDDHYNAFMTQNDKGKCPFCGLSDVKGCYHTKREAYDHYLPKDIYPFNSINFKNLAPMCHECNSSYKTRKDPLYNSARNRRKAFYPYSPIQPQIDIHINITSKDISKLSPDDIDLQLISTTHAEETETWRNIFSIDERYKAKCCGKNDGQAWFLMIAEEFANVKDKSDDISEPLDFYKKTIRAASRYQYSDSNFLKKAFLEACERAGLFNR